jgi:hypothetical protein
MLQLAKEVAAATGIDAHDAERALEARDPVTIELARQLVSLDRSRATWRSEMEARRRRLTAARG